MNSMNHFLRNYLEYIHAMKGTYFTFDKIEKLYYNFQKNQPKIEKLFRQIYKNGRYGRYIKTSDWIRNNKATVNVKCYYDDKCFQCSIMK